MVFRKERAILCPVGLLGASLLGWVCGGSSDPRQGAIMHWPLLSIHAAVVAFFQVIFFGWAGTTGITVRTRNVGKGSFAQHPSLRDALGLTLMEPASSNGFILAAFFSGLP